MTFSEALLSETGYQTKTTFWDDFAIAEHFGAAAIKDTYKRAFNEWKTNVEYITELVLVLNHKIWYHWEQGNHALGTLYDQLWRQCDEWCSTHLSDEDLAYYYDILD